MQHNKYNLTAFVR